ncbi:MAG: nucleotidyltransferase family protein [Gammaproteobacteria bacterium]|jgi:predicted nucleotidyltransferase
MSKLGDALFTTTQQKVLGLLYGCPDKSFYTKEIIRSTGMGVATIKRELDRMLDAGIISMNKVGNQHHYQANPNNPVYEELLSLVKKIPVNSLNESEGSKNDLRKSISSVENAGSTVIMNDEDNLVIADTLSVSRKALEKLARRYHIRRLVLFGSAARGKLEPDSDIDLLIEFSEGEAPSLGGMVKLQNDFMALFGGRKVDLATPAILNNPYRRRAIEKDMEELYAA